MDGRQVEKKNALMRQWYETKSFPLWMGGPDINDVTSIMDGCFKGCRSS